MFLRAAPVGSVVGIVSIHGKREFGVEAEGVARVDLGFDDVEVAVEGDEVSAQRVVSRRRWAEANGLSEVAPTVEDVRRIVEFAEKMREKEGVVLCQCGAGMSRAAAAGLVCLSVWLGSGSEEQCVRRVREIRRGAMPHLGVMRWADELLRREGALVRAVMKE
jgi:predicted protein tyrosine phosphatase